MSNVTVVDNRTARVVDDAQRVIEVRKLSSLQMMRLLGAVGPEKSENSAYMNYAVLASSVAKIDDTMIPAARSAGEVESIVGRLDEHGLNAVAEAWRALAPAEKAEDVANAAQNL